MLSTGPVRRGALQSLSVHLQFHELVAGARGVGGVSAAAAGANEPQQQGQEPHGGGRTHPVEQRHPHGVPHCREQTQTRPKRGGVKAGTQKGVLWAGNDR